MAGIGGRSKSTVISSSCRTNNSLPLGRKYLEGTSIVGINGGNASNLIFEDSLEGILLRRSPGNLELGRLVKDRG